MNTLILTSAAIVIGLFAAACSTTDPDVTSQLAAQSDQLAQLEEQIEELSASLDELLTEALEEEHEAIESSAFEVAVAQYVMDTAGFHALDDALAEAGEIDPSSASAVARVVRVVANVEWPHDLAEGAAHLLEVLTEFQAALAEDDAESATPLAGMAHDGQHDLSAAITAWLSGEMPMEGEHEHDDGEGSGRESLGG